MSDILVNTENGVCTITFNRPERKNALTVQMYADVVHAMRAADVDPRVHIVLFTGTGDSFTSGNDIADFVNAPPTGEDSPVFQFLMLLASFEKPIVVAVNGNAVGIGVTMLMHVDIVYVADSAKLRMPFVTLGLCPEAASSFLLPRMAGHARASELLMFAEPFDAQTAVDVGLACKVLPRDELMTWAKERCRILAEERPLSSLKSTKRLLRAPLAERVKSALYAEAAAFTAHLGSDEAREAFTAFFEKRKPNFAQFS
ncbi:MAG: enoyl-CoA hydratase [Deltaproteobacteria bacterium]|nr:enoyl-CoA hydratase [Deltaproteobacteria bacterium]